MLITIHTLAKMFKISKNLRADGSSTLSLELVSELTNKQKYILAYQIPDRFSIRGGCVTKIDFFLEKVQTAFDPLLPPDFWNSSMRTLVNMH